MHTCAIEADKGLSILLLSRLPPQYSAVYQYATVEEHMKNKVHVQCMQYVRSVQWSVMHHNVRQLTV
jgi:hypothetical protein